MRLHDLEVDLLSAARDLPARHAGVDRWIVDDRIIVRPPVVHLVDLDGTAHHDRLEVVHSGALPTRFEVLAEISFGGTVAPFAYGRGGALEHVQVLCRFGQRRHGLDAARPGAEKGDDLVLQAGERVVGPATGVLVVPACRVERVAGEVLHALDGRQLHEVEDANGQDVPATVDLVAAMGADAPARQVLVPLRMRDSGVEEGVVRQAVPLGDPIEVTPDLVSRRVAACGDVVELLEHRHVDVRLDVTHDTGVAIPVPGSPDATGLVDDADALDSGLPEVGTDEDTGDAAPHDDDIDLVRHGVTLDGRGERVDAVPSEVLVRPEVADLRTTLDE